MIQANDSIDVRRQVCSMPILKAKMRLNKLGTGQILEVVADYGPDVEQIERVMKILGHTILNKVRSGNCIKIFIKKQ